MNSQDNSGGNSDVNKQILADLGSRYGDDSVEYIFT